MFLEQIGADPRVRALFQQYEGQGFVLGRVSFASHEQYRIYLEDGEREAAASGRLRWGDVLPVVGDWVAVRRVDVHFALIEEVLPRATQFSRGAAGKSASEQVIASNIDLAVVVCGLDHDFNLRRLERYLVLARESGAGTVVVLNKADLCETPRERVAATQEVAAGVDIILLSALQTVEPLREVVTGRTVAFLGSSGAGKSTIVNGLLEETRQATGAVRETDSRGRHTTTSRMLMPLGGGGAVIDNPGMRELQLWASGESLDEVFAEIADIAKRCRFGDCTHTSEPDCAVLAALETGELNEARWLNYQKLEAELQYQHRRQDTQAALALKKKWKAIHKAMRHHPKYNR